MSTEYVAKNDYRYTQTIQYKYLILFLMIEWVIVALLRRGNQIFSCIMLKLGWFFWWDDYDAWAVLDQHT